MIVTLNAYLRLCVSRSTEWPQNLPAQSAH